MSKSVFLLLATVLVSLGLSAFAEPLIAEPVMQKPLFVKGVGGYNIYRIPALLTTQAGMLLAFCEGREAGDSSDIDLLMRRSEDGGETWLRKQVVWDQGKNVCGNPCPVQDRDTGIIWLLLTWNSSSDSGGALHKGTGKDTRRVYVCFSKDDGLTWSEPVEITETTKKKNWWWYATGPGVGIQLEQGPHKGRLIIPCDHTSKDGHGSHVIYSDDHGGTWQLGGSVEGGGANECQVVELADGMLMLNMRIQKGSQRKRGIATSRDGGETWSELELDQALIEPVCQASFLRYSPVSLKGKNRLLFSNPASTTDRVNMTVRISYDEGKTWPVTKQLYTGYSAYSCLTVLTDGDIGCFYEAGETKDAAIYFDRFPLAWLEASPDGAGAPGRDRYLLLDSRIIDNTENAELTLGTVQKDKRNPLFKEDKRWEPRYDNVYCNVIYDEQDKLYKCWYSPFIIDERTTSTPGEKRNPESKDYMSTRPNGREMGVCYAFSRDGIHWEKPELGLVEFNGNEKNNILMRGYHFKGVFTGPHGAGVFKDLHESDIEKRYKMFFKGSKMAVAFSPDGLHWNLPIECPKIDAHGDTHNNAFWAPDLGKYIGITRLKYGRPPIRQVAWTESPDFVNWTKAKVVLEGIKPQLQTHDMVVFPTGGVYIGLLGMMDFPNAKSNFHTKQHVELAWSPDTVTWHRIQEGIPFIGHTPGEEEQYGEMPYDWGTIFASAPIFLDDEVRIYYGACDWYFFDWRKGYLALATLRLDGWAGYEQISGDKPAIITTTSIVCTGSELQICADVRRNGFVKVKLFDNENKQWFQSKLITRTVTDTVVKWQKEFSIENVKGENIRLKFELKNAKLYSFGFDLKSQAKIISEQSKSIVDSKEDIEEIVSRILAKQRRHTLSVEEQVPGYVTELRDANPRVRENAARALGHIGTSEAKENMAAVKGNDKMKRDRFLLLDSHFVERTTNAKLTVGKVQKDRRNPLFAEDKPWEPRFDNLYANVIYDREEDIYKCWYSPFIIDESTTNTHPEDRVNGGKFRYMGDHTGCRREMGICYAVSRDGIRWKKPSLGIVEFRGSKENNIVWRGPHGAGVFKDFHDPDMKRRYKMFFKGQKISVAFSHDGLYWSETIECPEANVSGDTHNNAFWAPTLAEYVGITRTWARPRGRQVARTSSKDFLKWTKAKVVLEGLEDHLQTYAMPVFYYAGIYIGLPAIYNSKIDRTHTELAWSPDTVTWHRIDPGSPLIANSPRKGDYDWGCAYTAAYPVFLRDQIRLYYGGSDDKHFGWRKGAFCLATLRPDGFAGYEQISEDASAFVITTPMLATGQPLSLSADVQEDGFVRTRLLNNNGEEIAQAEPVSRTVTDARVEWRSEFTTKAIKGKTIRLEFEMRNAKLYSFSFLH